MLQADNDEKEELLKMDILCLTETWHRKTPEIPDYLKDEFILLHETLATKEKLLGRSSGGMIIFMKKQIKGTLIEFTQYWCLLRLTCYNEQLTLGVVYFKPTLNNYTVVEMIEEIFEKVESEDKLILAGDFNSRIGNMNYMEPEILLGTNLQSERQSKDTMINDRGHLILDVMAKYGMIVLNGRVEGDVPGEYTFVGTGGVSTVDLVWVNIQIAERIKKMEVTGKNLNSDHLALYLQLEGYKQETSDETEIETEDVYINKYIWEDEKTLAFTNEIENKTTSSTYTSLQEAIRNVSQNLNLMVKINTNKKTLRRVRKKPWYNNKCITLKYKMRRAYRKWKKEDTNIQSYLDAKKQYIETVKTEEKNHNEEIQKKLGNVKNSTEFWNEVRKFRSKKSYQENKIPIHTWEQYLLTLFDQQIQCNTQYDLVDARHEYFDAEITSDEMFEAILRMKNRKTPGPDGLINEQIKNLNNFWYDKLLSMYNYILDTNEVPTNFAKLDMVMIHKKGDKTTPQNFRSIALLNNLFKILTQILASRIYTWSEDNNIINEGQMGFRKNRGCLDGIYVLSSIVSLRIQSLNRKVYASFIDFRKAFSSVPHDKLWQKLFHIGLSSKIIRTIATLYSHAHASIKVDGKQTSEVRVTTGVLEGRKREQRNRHPPAYVRR